MGGYLLFGFLGAGILSVFILLEGVKRHFFGRGDKSGAGAVEKNNVS